MQPNIEIRDLPGRKALTCAHTGPYMQIGGVFQRLCGWLEAHDAFPPGTRLIGIYYDDPALVPEEKLRSRAGAVFPEAAPQIEGPFEWTEIPGGTYAVLLHKGPYSGLPDSYRWLFQEWLPHSGRTPADHPAFEGYLNSPQDTAPEDLLTEIFLPLR
jgi:AraC family transcriptional regulator